jgi:hypothetical protein
VSICTIKRASFYVFILFLFFSILIEVSRLEEDSLSISVISVVDLEEVVELTKW